jgi:diguanylate cyclase (GGDEF)-like protein
VQGRQALVGRMPVFLPKDDGSKEFWGLVSITLKYPEILDEIGLTTINPQGFKYEIWRINPDTNKKQIIASNTDNSPNSGTFLERKVEIFNADWYFRAYITNKWYSYFQTWFITIIGLTISLLISFIIQKNFELKAIRCKLESLASTDALTGIFNRRFFLELAQLEFAKIKRKNDLSYIIMFDIDHFKKVNDVYGHLAGDEVLKSLAQRIKQCTRPYDVFGRYGGEEFIVLVVNATESNIISIAERYRLCISDKPVSFGDSSIAVTASFGISDICPSGDITQAIKIADDALYKAKRDGRNRTIFLKNTCPIYNESAIN